MEKETTNKNTTPIQSGEQPKEKNFGSTIGVIIIVVVLALGGLYMWGSRIAKNEQAINEADAILEAADQQLESLESQSASDEIDIIEQDLSNTLLEGLDAELKNIEEELNF